MREIKRVTFSFSFLNIKRETERAGLPATGNEGRHYGAGSTIQQGRILRKMAATHWRGTTHTGLDSNFLRVLDAQDRAPPSAVAQTFACTHAARVVKAHPLRGV
jgi:hypothetical protein